MKEDWSESDDWWKDPEDKKISAEHNSETWKHFHETLAAQFPVGKSYPFKHINRKIILAYGRIIELNGPKALLEKGTILEFFEKQTNLAQQYPLEVITEKIVTISEEFLFLEED